MLRRAAPIATIAFFVTALAPLNRWTGEKAIAVASGTETVLAAAGGVRSAAIDSVPGAAGERRPTELERPAGAPAVSIGGGGRAGLGPGARSVGPPGHGSDPCRRDRYGRGHAAGDRRVRPDFSSAGSALQRFRQRRRLVRHRTSAPTRRSTAPACSSWSWMRSTSHLPGTSPSGDMPGSSSKSTWGPPISPRCCHRAACRRRRKISPATRPGFSPPSTTSAAPS